MTDTGSTAPLERQMPIHAIALLAIGVISGMMPPLQGTLLAQLAIEGRLSPAQVGQAATAEALGTLLAVTLANAALKPQRLRLCAGLAATIAIGLDAATGYGATEALLALRFAHGCCAGLLLWIWVGFLARCPNPARWAAAYVTAQAALLLAMSWWLANRLFPLWGAAGGYAAIAAIFLGVALLGMALPRAFPALEGTEMPQLPAASGWLALFAVGSQLAAILAAWVYLKPYGTQIGMSAATTNLAVSAAMGSQLIAGAIALLLAGRARARPVICFVALASVGVLVALMIAKTAAAYIAASVAFAFLWIIGPPFHMPYLIEIDPTRRLAMHLLSAQLVGVAAGPLLASLAVSASDLRPALMVAGALYLVGGSIVATGRRGSRESAAHSVPC